MPTLEHLLASRHTVVGVVTQPDRPRGRGQKVTDAPVKALAARARPAGAAARARCATPDVADALAAWRPDLGVVAAYGKLIPDALLALPRLGMINVHASLLPRYRGAAPVHRAVIDGDAETGVTIMRVVKALDAGAMFAKVDAADRPRRDQRRGRARPRRARRARCSSTSSTQIAAGTAHEEPQDDVARHLRARSSQGRRADRLDAAGGAHSQPGARPVSLAARLHLPRRRSADHPARRASNRPAATADAGDAPTGYRSSDASTRDGHPRRRRRRRTLAIARAAARRPARRCARAISSPAIRCTPARGSPAP